MTDKSSLQKEVESDDEDNMPWIIRKLPTKLLIMGVACVFFALGLDANGVADSYMFGWAAFLVCLGLISFND